MGAGLQLLLATRKPLSRLAGEISGRVRADLETLGQRIALAEDRILVTHNSREFGRGPA
jgi:hypothetical protein